MNECYLIDIKMDLIKLLVNWLLLIILTTVLQKCSIITIYLNLEEKLEEIEKNRGNYDSDEAYEAAIAKLNAAINAANAALASYTNTTDMNKAITDAEKRAKDAAQEAITELTQTVTDNLEEAKKYADDQDAALEAKINKTITDNEAVTAQSLTDLDTRVKANASAITKLTQTVADNLEEAKQHANTKAGEAQTTAEAFAKAYTDALFASITFATDTEIGGIFE